MKQLLADFEDRANRLNEILDAAIDATSNIPARYRQWTTSLGSDVNAVMARSRTILDFARGLSTAPSDRFVLAPASRLIAVRDSLDTVIAQTANFNEQMRNVVNWGGAISTDQVTLTAGNGNNVQVRQLLDNIWNAQDATLDAYLLVAPAIYPRGIGKFAAASRKLEEAATNAQELLRNLTEQSADINTAMEAIGGRVSEAEAAANEAQKQLADVENRRNLVDDQAHTISAVLATVDELRNRAGVLQGQVDEFEPKLAGFDENLSSRETAHSESLTKLAAVTAGMTTARDDLANIIKDAKDVLGQATIAGLSKEYSNQAKAVDDQLGWARWGYYFAIAFLLLSVLAAIGLISLGPASPIKPMPEWKENMPTGAYVVQLLGNLASRVLVILPAGLLAAFTSTRHSALFRLREEYNHKKGLAASINGFKEQAPAFADPMTAAVFQELLKNPALAIDGEADHSPNGYLSRLLQPKVREALAAMLAERDGLKGDGEDGREKK